MIILLPVLVVRDSISGLDKRHRISIEPYRIYLMQSRLQPKNWTIRLIIIVVVIVILLISIISNLWYFTDCSEMITPISNVSFARIFSKKEKRLHRSSIRLEIIQRSRATPYFLLLSRGFTLGWSPFFQDSVSRFTVWKRYFIYIYPSRSSWPRDEKVWPAFYPASRLPRISEDVW